MACLMDLAAAFTPPRAQETLVAWVICWKAISTTTMWTLVCLKSMKNPFARTRTPKLLGAVRSWTRMTSCERLCRRRLLQLIRGHRCVLADRWDICSCCKCAMLFAPVRPVSMCLLPPHQGRALQTVPQTPGLRCRWCAHHIAAHCWRERRQRREIPHCRRPEAQRTPVQ